MRTTKLDISKFLSLECPLCYKGIIEIVERKYKSNGNWFLKTIGVKKCPVCKGKNEIILVKH